MEEVPFEDRHVPRAEIDWDRSAWWWYPITRAIHPAVRMTSLALSLVALLAAAGGIVFGEWLFQPHWDADLLQWFSMQLNSSGTTSDMTPSILVWMSLLAQAASSFETFGLSELGFVTFEFFWIATTFAVLGGVLARRGAVELGQRTVAPWGDSFRIVFTRWQSYLWATCMHFVGISVLLLPALLLGLCSRLGSFGAIAAGIMLLLSFPLVFGIGRFALSALVCFPLSVCAISVEKKADAFEGFSRSNAYVFQRPVVGVFCSLLLLAAGLVGELIVTWTLRMGWGLVRGTFTFAGGPLADSNTFLGYGDWLSKLLIASFWFSYFWTAAAAVYLILRKSVDKCELDEMENLESEVEQSLPNIPTESQPISESTVADPEATSQ
jgi:hypothetical protein